MKQHYLIAIVYFLGQSTQWTSAAVTSIGIDQLDSFYLSKLRFEFRNLPKVEQCSQFWKSLDARLKGQEDQHTDLPPTNGVDTNLMTQVRDSLIRKYRGRERNSLMEFLNECAQLMSDHRQDIVNQPGILDDPIGTPNEKNPDDRGIGLEQLLRKNKEMIMQAYGLGRQGDNQIINNEELKCEIERLSLELERKNTDAKRDAELSQANAENRDLKQASEIIHRLTDELEKRGKEIEKLKQVDIEQLKRQLKQVSAENTILRQFDGDIELVKQLTAAKIEIDFLKRNIKKLGRLQVSRPL